MTRNGLYALIVLLAIVVVGLGVYVYHQQTKPGLSVQLDSNGIKVQSNG